MGNSTTKKRPQETPPTPVFMPLAGVHGPPAPGWPSVEFESVDGLREAHRFFLKELENLQTLEADIEALTSEKAKLLASGARESRQRLLTITSELTAAQDLLEGARDRAEAAERTFRALLHAGWKSVAGRASKLRGPIVAERERQLWEHPVISSAELPDKAAMIRAFAESWGPLRMLDVWVDDRWKSTLAEFESALTWIQKLEADPSKIEPEPSP